MSNAADDELPDLDDLEDWEQNREVYARAGLALYYAQVFEQGVVHALYAGQRVDGSLAANFSSADDFHAFIEKKTAGQVIKRLRRHLELSSDLDALLTAALNRRNFLVHRFFVERAELFFHQAGRQLMVGELYGATQLFRAADSQLETVMYAQGEQFGLTRELTMQIFDAMKAEAGPGGRSAAEIAEEVMNAAGYTGQQTHNRVPEAGGPAKPGTTAQSARPRTR